MIVVSQFYGKQEIQQVECDSVEDAAAYMAEQNAKAASGWRWGLSPTNWILESGEVMDVEQQNTIRRACGIVV